MEGRFAPEVRLASDYKSSDQLFNVCCYAFLCNVAPAISDDLYKKFKTLRLLRDVTDEPYDNKTAYGDLYRKFILALEHELGQRRNLRIAEVSGKNSIELGADGGLQMSGMHSSEEDSDEDLRRALLESDELDPVVEAVMVNDNLSLERAALMIADIRPENFTDYHAFSGAIKKRMHDTVATRVNVISPYSREGDRAAESVTSDFHEMGLTGIPCIKHYQYLQPMLEQGRWPRELRVGTQFVRTSLSDGYVSYIYQRWLQLHAKNQRSENHITHIYFHNMAKDKAVKRGLVSNINPAVQQEYRGTDLLIKLEQQHPNMLLIVLPADKGWMAHSMVSSHQPIHIAEDAKQAIFSVAMGLKGYDLQDFHMSERANTLVFGSRKDKEAIVRALIEYSFDRMGITDDNAVISKAQFQAVYFDFMKYQLPNFIIDRLRPDFVSYPCKNNIDRGGITSAYSNLMKSIDVGRPLSEAEFNQAVHAAPVLVKGRALNQHIKNLWNAVRHYLQGLKIKGEPVPKGCEYLVKWCEAHAYFGKDKGLEVSRDVDNEVLGSYLVARLQHYQRSLLEASHSDSPTLFTKAMNIKGGAVSRLLEALEGKDVTFTARDMDFFNNPDELEQTTLVNDTLPAIYRDAIQSGVLNEVRHLPPEADIEMDEMDSDHKARGPGRGSDSKN